MLKSWIPVFLMSIAVLCLGLAGMAQAQSQGRACTDFDKAHGYLIGKVMRAQARPLKMDNLPGNLATAAVIEWHRGAWENHPDNSFSGYDEARRLGAEMIEIDVRTDSQGQPWVIHDDALDRITNIVPRTDGWATFIRETP